MPKKVLCEKAWHSKTDVKYHWVLNVWEYIRMPKRLCVREFAFLRLILAEGSQMNRNIEIAE